MDEGAKKGARNVENAARGAGGRANNIFNNAFGRGGGPSRVFTSMALRIAALIPVLAALGGAISTVVSGLFAITSAAANAVYALSPLPGILSAVIQAGAVTMTAFSGIGDAVSAGLKTVQPTGASAGKTMVDLKGRAEDAAWAVKMAMEDVADAEREAARAIRDAQRQVRDAKENLRDVYKNVSESEQDAIEAVKDAEEDLAQAHKNVRKAQEDLTDARKEARERLIDLQFAERGGAIAQQRAIMALQDAQYQLNATSELPANNRLRQEALLAYEEAQLNLEMIQEQNGDTAEELEEIREKGINGTDEVVAAQEQLKDAQEDVRDATKAHNEAIKEQNELQQQNKRAIRDAKEALAAAKEALSDAFREAPRMIRDAKHALDEARESAVDANQAFTAGAPEVQKYQEELDKLSPPARKFVEFLISISDEMKSLRTAAQAGLFPGLQTAIETLVYGPLFPAVKRMMFETGRAVGDAAQSIAKDLSSGPFVTSFGNVATQNTWIIRQLGNATGDLARAFMAMMDAARPLTRELVAWFANWAEGLRVTTETKNETGELTKKFMDGGEQMKQLIRISKNLWEGISDIGKIAAPAGQSLLDAFENSTEAFAKFTDTKKNRDMLKTFFEDVATNFHALSSLILVVGGAFARLGADPALATIFARLEPTVLKIEGMLTGLLDEVGTDLIELVDAVLDAFTQISESGGLAIFLGTLTTAIKILTAAFETPVLGDALKLLVAVGAAMYAISIIRRFPGLNLLDKGLRSLFATNASGVSGFSKLKTAIAGIPSRARFLAGEAKAWTALRVELIKNKAAAIGHAIAEKARNAVLRASLALGALQSKLAKVLNREALKNIALKVKDTAVTVAKTVAEKAAAAASKAMAAAQWLVNAAMTANPIGLVVIAIAALVAGLIIAYKKSETFRNIVNGAFSAVMAVVKPVAEFFSDGLGAAFQKLIDWLKNNWQTALLVILTGPFGLAITAIRANWDKITGLFRKARDWVVGAFKAGWTRTTDVLLSPVRNAREALGKIFGAGGPIRTAFSKAKDWVVGAFKAAWNRVADVLTGPVRSARDIIKNIFGSDGVIRNAFAGAKNWVTGVFKGAWDKVKGVLTSPVDAAVTAIRNFLGAEGPLRGAFSRAVDAISAIWGRLTDALKKPARFVISTVYNDGLRAALNKIPGVNLGAAKVPAGLEQSKASGGVLRGWSPGRDIHRFYSPTGGILNLSGGEAVMRPEFTQAMGGEAGIQRLNALARKGVISKRDILEQSHASGGVVTVDGEPMSVIAAKQLALAEKLSGISMRVMQGSYQAASSYSGTSHTGGGVMDTSPGSFAAQSWLRKVGFAAWARNIPGAGYAGSGAHVHSVSRIDPAARGHAQLSSFARGEDGLGHADYGPNPPMLSNLSQLLGGISINATGGSNAAVEKGEKEKSKWTSVITALPKMIKGVWNDVKSMGNMGQWGKTFVDAGKSVLRESIDWMNDKIPNKIKIPKFPDIPLPDNPIKLPFDQGGIARGRGWMRKDIIGPERVLTTRQTESFDRLVAALEGIDMRGNSSAAAPLIGNLSLTVPQGSTADDMINTLTYEMRRFSRGGKYNR